MLARFFGSDLAYKHIPEVVAWRSGLGVWLVNSSMPLSKQILNPSKTAVVILSKKRYPRFTVLVGSKNGFRCDYK